MGKMSFKECWITIINRIRFSCQTIVKEKGENIRSSDDSSGHQ
jgi:hypothetical protein